ncbi:MAG: flagellar hook capping FlgD N-terminal domain-containing protein [Thalassobaculum sp.]|uniref:flagellar hook assembly protein FlgD n=1 Tax=Thalassobaculum sp. TaxID=2022740 RepID=UPI0032EB1DE1
MTDVSAIATGGTKSSASFEKLSGDMDMFLTLLTTQLRNQDPLDPMDNAEMTNQLVQFANVEQQITQNQNLEQMITLLNAQSAASAVGYIGKDVQYTDSTTTFSGAPVTFGYAPAKSADILTVKIVDSDGKTVRTIEGEKSASRHTITWDGTDDDGATVPDGAYTFVATAKNADDEVIEVDTDITGRVTGSALDSTGSYVLVGDLAVDVTKIVAVKEPSAAS